MSSTTPVEEFYVRIEEFQKKKGGMDIMGKHDLNYAVSTMNEEDDFYKERIRTLTKENAELKVKLSELTLEVPQLKKTITEKDNYIKKLRNALADAIVGKEN